MDFCNKISKISFEQFNKLPKTGKPNKNECTILSTIIQEIPDLNKFEVVALGTGTKCIGQNKMSLKGDILNDSHAEIICRRSFLLYIYSEIKGCLNKKESIFNVNDSKFEFNNKVNFHFFTTHIPCGDASIFPKNQDNFGNPLKIEENEDVPTKKRKLDIYRTGAKCLKNSKEQDLHLQGDLYHKIGLIRTKPGRGDPTLSISCSDKILKWCYIGIQGALLSILLKNPIYLSTITLSGNIPFNKESLNRAFNARFHTEFNHCNHYFKHNLIIYQSNEEFEFKKCDEKNQLCPSSISWNKFMM
nr:tRNA-specific adenosine deaminase 1-like [Onthophagus taurus]